jgi:hypothetical protein
MSLDIRTPVDEDIERRTHLPSHAREQTNQLTIPRFDPCSR